MFVFFFLPCFHPTAVPTVERALQLPADEFKAKYGRDKPTPETEVIFSCKLGGRAQTATNTALGLGFTKYVFLNYYGKGFLLRSWVFSVIIIHVIKFYYFVILL